MTSSQRNGGVSDESLSILAWFSFEISTRVCAAIVTNSVWMSLFPLACMGRTIAGSKGSYDAIGGVPSVAVNSVVVSPIKTDEIRRPDDWCWGQTISPIKTDEIHGASPLAP